MQLTNRVSTVIINIITFNTSFRPQVDATFDSDPSTFPFESIATLVQCPCCASSSSWLVIFYPPQRRSCLRNPCLLLSQSELAGVEPDNPTDSEF
jgi:hypothetical protein